MSSKTAGSCRQRRASASERAGDALLCLVLLLPPTMAGASVADGDLRLSPDGRLPTAQIVAFAGALVVDTVGRTSATVEALAYGVRVNGKDLGDAVFLQIGPQLLARRADWQRWRLKLPSSSPFVFEGEDFWPLDMSPGFKADADNEKLLLNLEFAATAFLPSTLDLARITARPPDAPETGAFFNYDFFGTRTMSRRSDLDDAQLSGLFEVGVFSPWGLLLNSGIGRDLDRSGDREFIRLESTWQMDFPASRQTLRIGDSVGVGGIWGRPVRFGGVRYGSNYGTQPGFISLPQPGVAGEAVLPSTVDVYINGIRRQSSPVQPGPFYINSLPVVTGNGDVQLVVRDVLGREQIVNQSFYTGARLLKAGLHDFSYEAGAIREDFARSSADYGRFLAAATHRYGFTNSLTSEVRGEILPGQQTLGLSAVASRPLFGAATLTGVYSNSDVGSDGGMALLAYERQSRRGVSFGLQGQFANRSFRQLGLLTDQAAPFRVWRASAGCTWNSFRFGLGYVQSVRRPDAQTSDVVSASITTRIGRIAALGLTAFRQIRPDDSLGLNLYFNMPLGRSTSAAASYQSNFNDGETSQQPVLSLRRNLQEGPGWGYRALVSTRSSSNADSSYRGEGGLAYQNEIGTYSLEGARSNDADSLRANVSGGMGVIRGMGFLSRKITEGFGVVELPGIADAEVYVNGQLSGRTDSDGRVVLPRLLAYQENRVRVDMSKLPMDVESDGSDAIAVPYFRSGTLVKAPVRRVVSALVIVQTENGKPLPANTPVARQGDGAEYAVGREGQMYYSGAPGMQQLRAQTVNGACQFSIDVKVDAALQQQIGPVTCIRSTQ